MQNDSLSESDYRELAEKLEPNSVIPLYRQISAIIEEWVEVGRMRSGDQLASERRLTEILRVSRRTVRTALADLIERKFVSATHGRGNYILEPPNRRELRFLAPESFAPDHWGLAGTHYDWIHRAEEEVNCRVHYTYTPSVEKFRQMLRSPLAGYDGMLIFRPRQPWVEELLATPPDIFAQKNLNLVVANRDLAGSPVSYVTSDHYDQSFRAVARLLEAGHRKIGYIGGELSVGHLKKAHEGYISALTEARLAAGPEDSLFLNYLSPENMEEKLGDFLKVRKFTGLIVVGSAFTAHFERACLRAGILVPSELSVVVVTEPYVLENLAVRWTAYLSPTQDVIRRSLEVLSDLSRGVADEPVQQAIPPVFEKGATCMRPC